LAHFNNSVHHDFVLKLLELYIMIYMLDLTGTSNWESSKWFHSRRVKNGLRIWLHVSSPKWVCQASEIYATSARRSCWIVLGNYGLLCWWVRERIHDGIIGKGSFYYKSMHHASSLQTPSPRSLLQETIECSEAGGEMGKWILGEFEQEATGAQINSC